MLFSNREVYYMPNNILVFYTCNILSIVFAYLGIPWIICLRYNIIYNIFFVAVVTVISHHTQSSRVMLHLQGFYEKFVDVIETSDNLVTNVHVLRHSTMYSTTITTQQ